MDDQNTDKNQNELKSDNTVSQTDEKQEEAVGTSQIQETHQEAEVEKPAEPAEQTQKAQKTPPPDSPHLLSDEKSEETNSPTVENEKSETDSSDIEENRRHQTPADPTKNPHWYVVHTYSGHEQKVSNTLKQRIESLKLQDKILDIIIPTQEKIEIKEGKKATVKEKIFPGYLLVKMIMDDNSWVAVRTTPGITGFIGTSTKPTPLPEEEVATIKRYMTMEAPKFKTTFSEGEAVKITDGPFSEFLGTISEIDEAKGKLKVMVSVFGRETPVELDLLQVAKL